jgi:hypothetical protein
MERVIIYDGTQWPNPSGEEYKDLMWRLRYATTFDREDMQNAANVMESYSGLILHPSFTLETVRDKISGIRREICGVKRVKYPSGNPLLEKGESQ